MAYSTRQDFVDRFGVIELLQLVDRNRDDVEDAGVLDQAIGDAAAEIDGYLVSKYQLPLVAVPAVLVRLSCDIVRYRLFDSRALDEVRARYTDAVKYLVNVSQGIVQLALPTPPAPSVIDPEPESASADRVFSSTNLSDF